MATGLAHFMLILPAIMISETWEQGAGRLRNLLMTTAGAVTYIISGSATLNFYIPQVKMKQHNQKEMRTFLSQKSTEQYPRSSGLALASLTIITGAVFLGETPAMMLSYSYPTCFLFSSCSD